MTKINVNRIKNEIEYNLSIMEESLSKGIKVDAGFLPIFQNDIESLGNHSYETELNDRLQITAQKLYKVASGKLDIPEATIPLISPTAIPANEIPAQSEGPRKQGLKVLSDNGIGLQKIRGDGHCLFRAIAAQSLFTSERTKTPSSLFQLAQKVESSSNYDHRVRNTAQKVVSALSPQNNRSALATLSDSSSSNLLVEFLRLIAVHGMNKNMNESLQNILIEEAGSVDEYLKDMSDMSKRAMGGQPEIIALEKALGSSLRVLQLHALGTGSEKLPEKGERPLGSTFLLYTPGHYDLGRVIN